MIAVEPEIRRITAIAATPVLRFIAKRPRAETLDELRTLESPAIAVAARLPRRASRRAPVRWRLVAAHIDGAGAIGADIHAKPAVGGSEPFEDRLAPVRAVRGGGIERRQCRTGRGWRRKGWRGLQRSGQRERDGHDQYERKREPTIATQIGD